MGYSTEFQGKFQIAPAVTAEHQATFKSESKYDKMQGYQQWELADGGAALRWDGGEKFYDYERHLKWACDWLKERGYFVAGAVKWQGESLDDSGLLIVKANVVSTTQDQGPTVTVHVPEKWIDAVRSRDLDGDDFARKVVVLADEAKRAG